MKHLILLLALLLFFAIPSLAQVIASGKVYDGGEHIVLAGASVQVLHTTTGQMTDTHGGYYLHVKQGDTLVFSFIGFRTHLLPIPKNSETFFSEDIFLAPSELNLPDVEVNAFKNYRQDSIENRRVNEQIFNYRQKSIGEKLLGPTLSQLGIHPAYRRARAHNSLSRFQNRLIEEEQQRYVDKRFNKALVASVTKLHQPLLDLFMKKYRPSYDFLIHASEYEFLEQIATDKKQFERELAQ